MRNGHTLLELLTALMILGILAGIAAPPVARWRDAAAATAARDELAARTAWTRIAAASHGGAQLVLEVPSGRYRVDLADGQVALAGDLEERHRVWIESGGVADSLVLRFDALGIGRMTGRTIRVRRGAAVAGLTITPFGRARRW
jgi:prepilin-type N-terminal cleavage/methylation domain-containing protein